MGRQILFLDRISQKVVSSHLINYKSADFNKKYQVFYWGQMKNAHIEI